MFFRLSLGVTCRCAGVATPDMTLTAAARKRLERGGKHVGDAKSPKKVLASFEVYSFTPILIQRI